MTGGGGQLLSLSVAAAMEFGFTTIVV